MSASVLVSYAVVAINMCFLLGYIASDNKARQAVAGSYQRYRASTLKVAFAAASTLTMICGGIVESMQSDYFGCAVYAVMFLAWLSLLGQALDDDNWFSGQGQRLKRWSKKVRNIRIHFRMPSPQSSPT